MTTDEKDQRITDALRGFWQADQLSVTTAQLASASGLSAAVVRSSTKGYIDYGGEHGGATIQVGDQDVRVRRARGTFSLAPEEGWPAFWARHEEEAI